MMMCYAEPTYGPSGELEDGGADLTMGGMCSYYHDLIYLAAIVQVASIVSDRIWWTFLVVSCPSESLWSVPEKQVTLKVSLKVCLLPCHSVRQYHPLILSSPIQVPAYALYVAWGMVQPYLGQIFGSGPKVSILQFSWQFMLFCKAAVGCSG